MAKRNKEEEKLHDFVLDELKKFHERKMEAYLKGRRGLGREGKGKEEEPLRKGGL